MFDAKFTKLIFRLRMTSEGVIPEYKSSALRGGMGQMLMQSFCVRDASKCDECDCEERCIVQNIMYAPFRIKPDFVTNVESAGYTLCCNDMRKYVKEGDELEFQLILYADMLAFINPILGAFYSLGQVGLGKERITFDVVAIQNRCGGEILNSGQIRMEAVIYETLEQYIQNRLEQMVDWQVNSENDLDVRLIFDTPCSLKYRGKICHEFQAEAVFAAICRRIYMLNLFAGYAIEMPFADLDGLSEEQHSEQVQISRYSERKAEKMPLRGIKGKLSLSGVSMELLQILIAGEILPIGKNSKFGFGVYHVKI